jgi:hypothetical protein
MPEYPERSALSFPSFLFPALLHNFSFLKVLEDIKETM